MEFRSLLNLIIRKSKVNGSLLYLIVLLLFFILLPSNLISSDKFKLWDVSVESGRFMMTFKLINLPEKKKSPQFVLDRLFGQIKKSQYGRDEFYFEVIAVLEGMAFVKIQGDADLITQRSGTAGAENYIASVLFNLTEFSNIRNVYFLDEGDHFISGKYERLDYWEYMSDYRRKKNEELAIKRADDFLNSYVFSKYVDLLSEVGNEDTIIELEELLKANEEMKNYREEEIEESIEKIKKRLNASE